MTTPTVSATREGDAIHITASATVNKGGYSLTLENKRQGPYLTLTVTLTPPQPDWFVTQAFETLTLDETVPIPDFVEFIDVKTLEITFSRSDVANFKI